MTPMTLFRISITPPRRAAARFIARVRRSIQKAYIEEQRSKKITQSDIARSIGVHRSVINRELRGRKDITLGRVAELAWALGREISFDLQKPANRQGANTPPIQPGAYFQQRQSTTEGLTSLSVADDRIIVSRPSAQSS